MRAEAINIPGKDLSQPAIVTIPSNLSACITNSTESAKTSRDTKDVFINLLKSNSDLVKFYCIWGLWKIGEFEIVSQYLDIKNEKSEMILQEYQRLNEMIYSNK